MFVEISFILIGFLGVLMRRNLIAIGFSFIIVFLGIELWFNAIQSTYIAKVLAFMFALQIIFYGILLVFLWRNKGTLHIDEIQELKG